MRSLSRVRLFAAPWTVAYQAPPSMGFSRQEYRSGLPFPSPEDLPNPGIEPGSPVFQAVALTSELPGKPHLKDCYKYLYAREFDNLEGIDEFLKTNKLPQLSQNWIDILNSSVIIKDIEF